MKIKCKLFNITKDFATDKPVLSFIAIDNIKNFDEIQNGIELDLEVSKHKRKRGLDANAFAWVLMGKLQEATGIEKTIIYKETIKNIAPYETLPVKNEAVERFINAWSRNGLGWVCDTLKSKLEGYTNVLAYYGSSTFTTKQMSRFIDALIFECEQFGIETKTKEEIDSLLKEWDKK